MTTIQLVVTVALGLLVNEFCDLSPWLARWIVRGAAKVWTQDRELSLTYVEEWQAYINERPGKLFKLGTALGLLVVAAANRTGALVGGKRLAGLRLRGFARFSRRRIRTALLACAVPSYLVPILALIVAFGEPRELGFAFEQAAALGALGGFSLGTMCVIYSLILTEFLEYGSRSSSQVASQIPASGRTSTEPTCVLVPDDKGVPTETPPPRVRPYVFVNQRTASRLGQVESTLTRPYIFADRA